MFECTIFFDLLLSTRTRWFKLTIVCSAHTQTHARTLHCTRFARAGDAWNGTGHKGTHYRLHSRPTIIIPVRRAPCIYLFVVHKSLLVLALDANDVGWSSLMQSGSQANLCSVLFISRGRGVSVYVDTENAIVADNKRWTLLSHSPTLFGCVVLRMQ